MKYKLFIENDFNKYKKIMTNKELINDVNILMKWLKNCINNSRLHNYNTKIFLTAIMIYNFPDGILGNTKERHPIDIILYDNINALINCIFNIMNYSDIKKLINHITIFEELFNEWKNMDMNRTIQNIIISYKHRQDHIKYIKNGNGDNNALATLNNECDIMLKNILSIDSTYNIDYVKNNYNEIYEAINITTHKIENKIKSNFHKAYIDYLVYEFSNNNDLNIIKNLIFETNERIILCVPVRIKNAIKNKLNKYNYNEILLENDWSDNFNDYFKFIIDTIICCDKKNIFDINIINVLYQMVGNNYHHTVPYILVHINMLIDLLVI
jgi:hypothetical protein